MNINNIKIKIKDNYRNLSTKRKETNKPVFSIEHNLSKEEYKILLDYIQACSYVNRDDELLWLVYATEIGYEINKFEYWDSFQENLKADFADHDNRNIIRSFFNKFIREYNGYKPQGTFAQHYTIICLPIYNAILPKYLQNNLARLLFYFRHSFEDYKDKNYLKFGNFLSRQISYHNFSKLFRKFSEDEEMLGKIAYALIDENDDSYYDDIEINTFKRIIDDCEQARETKDWLNYSRSTFRKVKFQGLRKNITNIFNDRNTEEARELLNDFFIKPQLLLIKEKDYWKTYLRFESFEKNFLKVYPEFREVFLKSYCVINNEVEKNARNLQRNVNEILINKWIDYKQRIIEFKSDEDNSLINQLNFTLQNECFLVDDKIWLFKVSEFSYAKEIVGKTILPNTNYLIISREALESNLLTEEKISTENVKAYTLTTKENFTKEDMDALKELNLFPYSKIIFKPIGYPPQNFDDEESSSWTVDNNPCFKIEADQPIQKITFNFKGERIEKLNVSDDLYIQLNIDDLGSHDLHAVAEVNNFKKEIIEGKHKIKVHEKNIWDKSLINNDILYTETEPINPSLDDLIENNENKCKFEIFGPSNLDLVLKLTINNQNDEILIFDKFPKLKSNVISKDWTKYFHDNILNNKNTKIYEKLILGDAAKFEFTSENIGRTEITFESEVKPLQFKYTNIDNIINLYVIDNSGNEPIKEINAISFEKPDSPIAKKIIGNKIRKISKGGIYFSNEIKGDQAFLTIPRINFEGIGLEKLLPPKITLRKPEQTAAWVSKYVYYYRLWYKSKIIANRSITFNWVKDILYEIHSHLSYCICFDRNNDANKFSSIDRRFRKLINENKITEANILLSQILNLISTNTNENAYLKKISNSFYDLNSFQKKEELLKYFKTVKRIPIDGLDIDFALLLAFAPELLHIQYGNSFNFYVQKLFKKPEIFRSIRYLILVDLLRPNNEYVGLRSYGKNWKWV